MAVIPSAGESYPMSRLRSRHTETASDYRLHTCEKRFAVFELKIYKSTQMVGRTGESLNGGSNENYCPVPDL